MKLTRALLIPLILLASSCVVALPLNGVVGNGRVVAAALPVSGFSAVKNMSSARVLLNRGPSSSATVKIDENLVEELDIHVQNDVLIIGLRPGRSIYRYTEFTVTVSLPTLREIGIYGSGDIAAAETFRGQSIALGIYGSGSISGNFEYGCVSALIKGSGDIRAVGSADRLEADIEGSGDILASGLKAESAIVRVNGSGSCTLTVEEALDARIHGSGSIYYYGSPMISQVDAGSGGLRKIGF